MSAGQIVALAFAVPLVLLLIYFLFRTERAGELAEQRQKVLKKLPDLIVTAPGIVVSYRPSPEKLSVFTLSGGEAGVSKKLSEMLAANPDTDLAKFADSFGITVTNVERKKPEDRSYPGIIIGHD